MSRRKRKRKQRADLMMAKAHLWSALAYLRAFYDNRIYLAMDGDAAILLDLEGEIRIALLLLEGNVAA